MRFAELVRHHDDHRSIGLVTCPNCRVDMPRVGLKDTESEKNLREATYHWSEVRDRNTAVDRAIEASEASHSSQTYFSDRPRRAHRKRMLPMAPRNYQALLWLTREVANRPVVGPLRPIRSRCATT
jgi:hypothetical protein